MISGPGCWCGAEGSGEERGGRGQERWKQATSVHPQTLPPVRSCLGAWGCHRGSQSPLPTGGPWSSTWGQWLRLALWVAAACLTDEPEGAVGPPPGSMLSTSAFPGGVARRGQGAASWEALQSTGQGFGVRASARAGLPS